MAISDLAEPKISARPAPSLAGKAASSSQQSSSQFPLKTALAIAVVASSLAAWHFAVDRARGLVPGLTPAAITETFRLHWPSRPAPAVPARPHIDLVKLPPSNPFFVDDSNNLDPFFASLWKLEKSHAGTVTILHYGDSPTTADLITGDIRAQLQSRFGDAGRGYTLIAKPWAWYAHRGIEMSSSGWKIRTGVGLIREGVYGLGGAAFEGSRGAWSKFVITGTPQSAVEVEFLTRPGGGSFTVWADANQIAEQWTASETQTTQFLAARLPAGTQSVTIRASTCTVTLFGVDFRRGESGLLYDSLGLNGATTSVLARVMQPEMWKQQLDHAGPALVIVNYGSNESSFSKWVDQRYADELRMAIARIHRLAPQASILVMSPMDRGQRASLDEIQTMSTIPQIVAIERQVAAETHCAFFDTYDAMGSSGTMARWYAASPRLVTADLLHPTPQGASIVAGLFLDQVSLGYDRWKMQRGIPVPSAPAAPALQAATVKVAPNAPQNPSLAGRHRIKKAGAK